MMEFEKTFLLKKIPANLAVCESTEILDIYFPAQSKHPKLRLRKQGEKYEICKKEPIDKLDASEQLEQSIILTEDEFLALSYIVGKKIRKLRFYMNYQNHKAEIDVFLDDLHGLVLADFEFASREEKEKFEMPDFCLADVTQEDFIAGGRLCGKKYSDIKSELARFAYEKLQF